MDKTNKYKVATFLILICVMSLILALYSRVSKDAIKSSLKTAYSVVIKTQLEDGVGYDSISNNIDRYKNIDSVGYSSDVEAIKYIILDYNRLSKENDSLKGKK